MKPALPCLVALACAALPVAAQVPDKLPLAFVVNANDDIGQRIAYVVRDRLRRAPTVALSPDKSTAWMVVTFNSMRVEGAQAAAYMLEAVLNDRGAFSGSAYWNSWVGSCGSDATAKCAQSVLAAIDQAVTDFQAEYTRRTAKQPDKKP